MGQLPAMYVDQMNCQSGLLRIDVEYTSGAAGAIPASLTRSNGVSAVTRTGTGVTDFVLNNPAVSLVNYLVQVIAATPANTAAGSAESTLVDAVTNTSTPKVTVTHRRNDTYAAVDSASGDVIKLTLWVKTNQNPG